MRALRVPKAVKTKSVNGDRDVEFRGPKPRTRPQLAPIIDFARKRSLLASSPRHVCVG